MNLKTLISKVKDFVVTRKEKAVLGAVMAAVSAYFVQSGATIDQVFSKQGLYALIVGVLTHIVVYWVPNTSTEE